jgi:hypothetical protein
VVWKLEKWKRPRLLKQFPQRPDFIFYATAQS